MRTGEPPRPRPSAGFTYLWLLFFVAVSAAAATAAMTSVQTAAQRERETELVFRGSEFSRALASYRDASVDGESPAPATLEDLLEDRRRSPTRHHLRRIYTDPFTGAADWILTRDAAGHVVAVRSRSTAIAMRHVGVPAPLPAKGQAARIGTWEFRATAPMASASAASAPQESGLGSETTAE